MVGPRYDVSGTSPRTKSHHAVASFGEANACTPPTGILACDHDRRQVSWLAGRYLSSPSRDRDSQWHMTEDSSLTVAGAAAALEKVFSAPHSLLIPKGTVSSI